MLDSYNGCVPAASVASSDSWCHYSILRLVFEDSRQGTADRVRQDSQTGLTGHICPPCKFLLLAKAKQTLRHIHTCTCVRTHTHQQAQQASSPSAADAAQKSLFSTRFPLPHRLILICSAF
uniref:Uncharacterized protein n=1 Tax=Setaria digitata TaxID=48799 RepID=A0A915PJ20_9BILA